MAVGDHPVPPHHDVCAAVVWEKGSEGTAGGNAGGFQQLFAAFQLVIGPESSYGGVGIGERLGYGWGKSIEGQEGFGIDVVVAGSAAVEKDAALHDASACVEVERVHSGGEREGFYVEALEADGFEHGGFHDVGQCAVAGQEDARQGAERVLLQCVNPL